MPILALMLFVSISCVLLIKQPYRMKNADINIKKTERRQRIFGIIMLVVCFAYIGVFIFLYTSSEYADKLAFNIMDFLFGKN